MIEVTMRELITSTLQRLGEATKGEIAKAAGVDVEDAVHELNQMMRDAEVERRKEAGAEYRYWLTATAPPSAGDAEWSGAPAEQPAAPAAAQVQSAAPTNETPGNKTQRVMDALATFDRFVTAAEVAIAAGVDNSFAGAILHQKAERRACERMQGYGRNSVLYAPAGTAKKTVAKPLPAADSKPAAQVDEHALASLTMSNGRLQARVIDLEQQIESGAKAYEEASQRVFSLEQEIQALRERLAEEEESVDVKEAAVAYLVRAPKRRASTFRKPEAARDKAMAAARSGAGYADVFALVPLGRAVRGAEWKERAG